MDWTRDCINWVLAAITAARSCWLAAGAGAGAGAGRVVVLDFGAAKDLGATYQGWKAKSKKYA